MFGKANDGVLNRSAEFILKSKPFQLSAIEMKGNNLFDLANGASKSIKNSVEASKTTIESVTQFNEMVAKVLEIRSQKATDENQTSSRSHLMFEISLGCAAQIAFVDLAGWENPGNKAIDESKFINASLTSLNTALSQIAKKKIVSFDAPITKWLKHYLRGQCIIMMYHVKPSAIKKGLENIKEVVATAKAMTQKRKTAEPLQDITNKLKRY